MPTSSVSSKGQVTLPEAVREHLALAPGSSVEFVLEEDGTVILQKRHDTAHPLRGILHAFAPDHSVSIEAMDEAAAQEVTRLDQDTHSATS